MCNLRFVLTLILCGFAGIARAQQPICSIAAVSVTEAGIELHFAAQSGVFVRISRQGKGLSSSDRMYDQINNEMHEVRQGGLSHEPHPSKVVLGPGDEAHISNNPHASCTVVSVNNQKSSGVVMKLAVSLPGLEPQVTSHFLAAGSEHQ